jgi:hypothetical protein
MPWRYKQKRLLACNGKPQKEEFWSRAALDQNSTGKSWFNFTALYPPYWVDRTSCHIF